MSSFPSFVLRSNNGTGEVYLSVQGNTVTEICLFASKISMEQYPLDIRWLAIKSGIWAVKEVTAEQFEQAKLTFSQKAGLQTPSIPDFVPAPPVAVDNIPAFLNAPNGSIQKNVVVAQALNGMANGDGEPF